MNLRRIASVLAVVALLAGIAPTLAGGEEVTMTGWITDSYCGKSNANADGKTCTLQCAKDGAKLVLFANDRLWELDDQDLAVKHVGHEVRVTGMLSGENVIEVSEIKATSKES